MPHFIRLHLTTLDDRSKPATGSEHLLVGMKIAIPVLPYIGEYIIDDARSCVNDDCFDLPAFSISRVDKQRNEPGRWKSRIVAIFLLFLTLLHVLT